MELMDDLAREQWAGLDEAWREAFGQAWEALRTGNIPVGACASTRDGEIVHAARNRVFDDDGPAGEIFGSALAHAETNVLARLRFRQHRDLVLTTTLQPCLQCAAAIRLGPVGVVRFAGPDPYWDGCHEFWRLSEREARHSRAERDGPRRDEVGVFATLIARIGPGTMTPAFDRFLRTTGEGPALDLVRDLQADLGGLAAMPVADAFARLWPRLRDLRRDESRDLSRDLSHHETRAPE